MNHSTLFKKVRHQVLLLAFLSGSAASFAQTDLASRLDITVGGTFGKPKIIPNLNALGLAQLVVNYKLSSTKTVKKTEKKYTLAGKKNVASATGSVTAYLDVADGMTDADFQEITDHFYNFFQSALQKNNIDTVSWSKIAGTNFYQDAREIKENSDDASNKQVTYSAHAGNIMYNGGMQFAFGKMKKASNFCDEIEAPAAFVFVTLDFADIQVDVDVRTYTSDSYWSTDYHIIRSTTNKKAKTNVAPLIKVAADGGNSLFWNEKTQSENLVVTKDIIAPVSFATEVTEDASKLKKKTAFQQAFGGNILETTPVVIVTTKEKYKAAAKQALENYALAMVAKAKNVK